MSFTFVSQGNLNKPSEMSIKLSFIVCEVKADVYTFNLIQFKNFI